jgi:hypothetical protein
LRPLPIRTAAKITRHNSNSHVDLEPESRIKEAYFTNNETQVEIRVGVDTSQSRLDIYVSPRGDYFSVENTPEDAKQAAKKSNRVLIEARGRLELNFVWRRIVSSYLS